MTTGCVCGNCGIGLAPAGKQCQGCDERDMTCIGRFLNHLLQGKPLGWDGRELPAKEGKQRLP